MRIGALLLTLFLFHGPAQADDEGPGLGGSHNSQTFAYELDAPLGVWFKWSDLEDDYVYADSGTLALKGYGAVVMPVCWDGARPTQLALLEVFMERFGEEYPTSFVRSEAAVAKGDATGTYLVGNEPVDDEDYTYHFWIVANDQCAYTFAAWGPVDEKDTVRDLQALWAGLTLQDSPGVLDGRGSGKEIATNAFFLNQIGMHYFDARSYREAFRFLEQATDLDPDEPTYIMNALRVLTEIDAYREAYDWLQPRLANYGNDLTVSSWDAWLAYQVDDTDKAVRLYDELFSEGYREDDEFAVYAGLLADREEWDKIETDLAEYAQEGMTEKLQQLQADLLTRRGRYEEALAILEVMTEGRPFNADLVYSKIEVYDEMDKPAEVLRLADLLIEKNYRSLESYFYKGYAEYQLKSYLKARESFTAALKYSPTNSTIQDYLDGINGVLGEGENASISEVLHAVSLPAELQALVDSASYAATIDGYGAYFINRISGYAFDGSEYLTKTHVQQIKIQDAQGIEQFSTLEFNFDPAYEQFYVNRLVVKNADGEVLAEGDPAAYYVTSTVDGYEASTEKTAHLPVPSLAPGVVIEVVATKKTSVDRGEFPLDIHYLSGSRPIQYSAVFVSGEHDRLGHESFGLDTPLVRDEALVWELTDPVVYRWERYDERRLE
jgi:tetratricopeptide (TPR) repeat protein